MGNQVMKVVKGLAGGAALGLPFLPTGGNRNKPTQQPPATGGNLIEELATGPATGPMPGVSGVPGIQEVVGDGSRGTGGLISDIVNPPTNLAGGRRNRRIGNRPYMTGRPPTPPATPTQQLGVSPGVNLGTNPVNLDRPVLANPNTPLAPPSPEAQSNRLNRRINLF